MKKQLTLVLAAAMLVGSLAGCSSKTAETTAAPTTAAETTTAEATTEAETTAAEAAKDGGLKLGMSIITGLDSSKDAGEKDGNAQVDANAVAVIVDSEGKIVNCVIDTAQNKMGFTADGKIVAKEEFKSKKELKDEYNMRPASPIGKEWFEQAEAFEQYVIGKTAEEVKGIAVDEDTKPTDADLTAGCTMSIGAYQDAVVEAVNNAKALGTAEGDKLGIGVVTDMMYSSKDAEDGKDGLAQSDSTFAAVTVGADGKATAVVFDCVQGKINFTAEGVITSDLTALVKTKTQLGAEYGMKPASPIGKEWFEQNAALEAYVTGKTADEITGIAVDEDNKPTEADLTSSCTMEIGDFKDAAVKAINNAK